MLDNLSEKVKQLKDNITTSTKDYFQVNKDKDIIKFINKTLNKLDALVKSIDKFLKQKGIDVEKIYNDIKDKSIPFAKKAKTKGLAALNLAKDKALKTTIGKKIAEKGTTISSKLKSIFSTDTEKEAGPPKENKAKEDKEPSWLDKLLNRQNRRKKEIEAEKEAVQDKLKENKEAKKNKGWLGSILSGIASLGRTIISGIKSVAGWLAGFLFSGIKKLLPSLAKSAYSFFTKYIKPAGASAWGYAKSSASKYLPEIASRAVGIVARGALAFVPGPVGAALAIGSAIYAGYKLYKYFTRGDITDDIYGELTRLRLMMYGYNDSKKNHYAKLFDLDMLMKDYIEFKDHRVTFKNLNDKDFKEKVLKIFEVNIDEEYKYQVLNTWFSKRYLPAYKAYVDALYSVNNSIYFDEIDKLKPVQIFDLLSKLNIPTKIYDITEVPFFSDPIVRVTKEEVDILRDNLIEKVKKDIKTTDTFDADKKKKETEALRQKTTKNKSPNLNTNSNNKPVPAPNKDTKLINPDIDGEPKPKDVPTQDITTKVNNKLNITQGELYSGSTTLEGIATKLPKEKIYNLDPNVRELFTGMAKEYNALTGKTIPVTEAFRSFKDQQALYSKNPNKAAKPGTSLHEYGLAIDIDSETADELDKLGLMRKYGFTRPIGKETWHLEPIGVSMNPTLAKKDELFRFNAINASPLHGGEGYGTLSDSALKKRDITYQTSIYNEDNNNPIDPNKIKIENSSPLASIANKDKTIDIVKPKEQSIESIKNVADTRDVSKTINSNPLEKKEPPITLATIKPVVPQSSNMDIGKYANLSPEQAIKEAARLTGIEETYLLNFAKLESGLRGNARAKTSTAEGLFQITDSTWKELINKYGSKYNIPPNADKTNNFYNAVLAAEYAKENLARLDDYEKAGLKKDTAMYLAHHYGVAGANKIIKQMIDNPNAFIENVVSPSTFVANRQELQGNTVSSYIQKVNYKLGKAESTTYPAQVNNTSSTKGYSDSISTIPPNTSYNIPKPQIGYSSSISMVTDRPFINKNNMPDIRQNQPFVLNTEKMESILSNQLSTLTQIVNILTSIDGKIDISKLKDITPKDNNSFVYTQDKSQPINSIDLTRKAVKS